MEPDDLLTSAKNPDEYFKGQIEARMTDVYNAFTTREPDKRPPNWFMLDYKCAHLKVISAAYGLASASGLIDLTDLSPDKLEEHLLNNPISQEESVDYLVNEEVKTAIQDMWTNMIQAVAGKIYQLHEGDWTEAINNDDLDLADTLFNEYMTKELVERIPGTHAKLTYDTFNNFKLQPILNEIHHRCEWGRLSYDEDGTSHLDSANKEVEGLIIKALQGGNLLDITLTLSMAYRSEFTGPFEEWLRTR